MPNHIEETPAHTPEAGQIWHHPKTGRWIRLDSVAILSDVSGTVSHTIIAKQIDGRIVKVDSRGGRIAITRLLDEWQLVDAVPEFSPPLISRIVVRRDLHTIEVDGHSIPYDPTTSSGPRVTGQRVTVTLSAGVIAEYFGGAR